LSAERGNVSIIVALMATVLIGIAALAIDVGAMLVRQSQLQAGADAAAMAVARECAGFVVALNPANCNDTQALATATDYFTRNLPDAASTVGRPEVRTFHEGIAGRVTVSAGTQEPTMFGWALGAANLEVAANATARWGPLVAVDAVFPLAICKGALPEEDQPVELWSSTSGGEMLGACDGAPDALPLGWLDPTDTVACDTDITLLPPTYLAVAPSDAPPTGMGCSTTIQRLMDNIDDPFCDRACRTRVVAVYDAATTAPHRAYSLVAIQFNGARLGSRLAKRWWLDWDGICDPADGPYEQMDDLQCISGVVRRYVPPDDGPIVDLDDLSIAGIDEATVLDVKLID
jgi:hypothetical protein